MTRRFRDWLMICAAFLIFGVIMITITYGWEVYKASQNTPLLQEEEVPIIYDSPVQDPANYVEQVDPLPEFPSGDEFAAAVSFLRAYGYDVSIHKLLDYMNYSDTNFVEAYVGDARTDYGYCMTPALVICMNNYLVDTGGQIRTQNMDGMSIEAVSDYLNSNHPMIVWYTNDHEQPRYTGATYNNVFRVYKNAEVLVIYGIQNGVVAAMDPNDGAIGIPIDEFKSIWQACGSQAIGVYYVNL